MFGRFVGIFVILWHLSFVTGCATLSPTWDHAGVPRAADLTSVPFFPQQRFQCGPAALATLLTFAGRPTDPADLVEQIFVPARGGSFQLELIAAARAKSLLVYPLEPSFTAILQEIAHGNPVLVLQNLGLTWLPQWHYAVAVGYDLDQNVVILRSGVTERLELPLPTFVTTWQRAGSWAIMALPPASIPATASPNRYFQAANALEQVGNLTAARLAYDAATLKWPQDSQAWFLAGNAAYALGEIDVAENAFRRAAQLAPYAPLYWNNLAFAAQARGCGKLASVAAECAYRLAPDTPTIQDTHQKFRFLSSTDDVRCADLTCPKE